MVKPILQLYPVVPAAGEDERAQMRPLGRNVERYHEVVHGMTDLVKAADELGFWGVSTIEHHFHSEGYEVGPSPGTLNAYWAAVTKNVRVGQLGYTMSAQNPIRVAEETAILDHLERALLRRLLARLPGTVDQRARPAPRHARDAVARRAHRRGPRGDGPRAARLPGPGRPRQPRHLRGADRPRPRVVGRRQPRAVPGRALGDPLPRRGG